MEQQTHTLAGFHAVLSRARFNAASVQQVYIDQGRHDLRMQKLITEMERQQIRVMRVEKSRLDGMSKKAHHQGIVALVTDTPLPYQHIQDILELELHEPALFLILDGVVDPHNLGACLRVADAMGAHAVIAPKDRSVGLTTTVRRVACGAAETVPFLAVTNLARTLRELKNADVRVIGTASQASDMLTAVPMTGATALVLGSEGSGLRHLTQQTCDQLACIPMFGTVDSLNVSVAAGMCLYEARRQRGNQHD